MGGKEQKKMILPTQKLNTMLSGSELKILKGYTHGDISLNHPEEYVDMLLDLMK